MGSANIQAKVKRGLARAINKTGSAGIDLVYLVSKTSSGGNPLAPATVTTQDVLLVDAIFREYDARVFDVNILAGDRELVSNNDVAIKQGDIIKQGANTYKVISVEIKAPTSDVLVYISQLRLK